MKMYSLIILQWDLVVNQFLALQAKQDTVLASQGLSGYIQMKKNNQARDGSYISGPTEGSTGQKSQVIVQERHILKGDPKKEKQRNP